MQITENMDINIEPNGEVLNVTLKATGKLTHQDYQTLIPMMQMSIKSIPNAKVNMLLDATEFTGWEAQAAWDDFRFGMEYKDIFLKIAIVGTKEWQEYVAKIGDWFMHGEVKFFYDLGQAKAWID